MRHTLIFDKFLGLRRQNGVVDYGTGTISALECENVELYNYGQANNTGIRTQKGQIDADSLPLGFNIIGHWSSNQDGIEHLFVYAENATQGTLFTYEAGEFIARIENLTKTGNANGITLMQGLYEYFIFTNGEDFWSYSFARVPAAEEINAIDDQERKIKGLSLALSRGRLLINSENRCHGSKSFDFFTWDANDFDDNGVPIITNSFYEEFTNPVTAIASYIEGIIVFTERDSTLLQGNPMDLANYRRIDASIGGTVSFGSFVIHDQYLFYYDRLQKNIYYFLQNDVGQRRTGAPVASEIQEYLEEIDETKLNQIKMRSLYYDGRNQIWLLIPVRDGQRIFIYDYRRNEWITRKSPVISDIAIFDNSLYSASENKLMIENLGNLNFNSRYKLSIINMGSNTNLKIPKLIPTLTLDEGFQEFWVRIRIDDKNKHKDKIIRVQDSMFWAHDYDETSLNTIWDENRWSSDRIINQRVVRLPPIPAFRWLEIEFFTQKPHESFMIKNFELKRIRIKDKT